MDDFSSSSQHLKNPGLFSALKDTKDLHLDEKLFWNKGAAPASRPHGHPCWAAVLDRVGGRLLSTTTTKSERCLAGLVALAVSDLFFCLTVIPHAWVDKMRFQFDSRGFDLYYTAYGDAIVNSFITSSTWLTVAMATSRYLAVVHPIRARDIIGMTFAKVSYHGFTAIQMTWCFLSLGAMAWRKYPCGDSCFSKPKGEDSVRDSWEKLTWWKMSFWVQLTVK